MFKRTPLFPFGLRLEPEGARNEIHRLDIEELRALFRRHQLIALRGFGGLTSADDFSDYCARWGQISVWPFGKVLELVEQSKPEDHIFDHRYVPLHWDGMYRPQVPEYQIFHCVRAPHDDQGGRTTFSHSARALERARPERRELWARVTGIYHRRMEFYHSQTIAPLITHHPTRDFAVIRYCEPAPADDASFVNRPELEFRGLAPAELAELHAGLREALYSPETLYAHGWQTGDLVIADNHTLLHGREAFTSGAPRHLRRVHVLGATPLDNPHLVFHA